MPDLRPVRAADRTPPGARGLRLTGTTDAGGSGDQRDLPPADPLGFGRLGITLDPALLELALTHRSYAYEQGGLPTNERLEFLGDSVLGLVVTEHLYAAHPTLSEGQLAKLRAAVVNSRALADVARGLGIGPLVRLGRGEEGTGGRDKSSILADTTEALIGAVFVQHGIEVSRILVHSLFDPVMATAATLGAGLDWKTSLQEIASLAGLGAPVYTVTEEGPDHAKSFEALVRVGERWFGPGTGSNKKQAEQEAAAVAFVAVRDSVGEAVGVDDDALSVHGSAVAVEGSSESASEPEAPMPVHAPRVSVDDIGR